MDKMIAFCGLSCTNCGAYKATKRNDDKERKRVAKLWSKYKPGIRPEDINCDGCLPEDGRLWEYCISCEIRKCGLEKHVKNCAYCSNYICRNLVKFLNTHPDAESNLEEIRKRIK